MRVPRKDQRSYRARPVPRPTMDELALSGEQLNRAGTNFLKVDLAAGLTFADTALTTDDQTKKRRNQRSARKAYDTVLKMIRKVSLSEADAKELQETLQRLKSDLVLLGETF